MLINLIIVLSKTDYSIWCASVENGYAKFQDESISLEYNGDSTTLSVAVWDESIDGVAHKPFWGYFEIQESKC